MTIGRLSIRRYGFRCAIGRPHLEVSPYVIAFCFSRLLIAWRRIG